MTLHEKRENFSLKSEDSNQVHLHMLISKKIKNYYDFSRLC